MQGLEIVLQKIKCWTAPENFSRRRWRQLGETLFRGAGLFALISVLGALFFLLAAVFVRGYEAFFTTEMYVPLVFQKPITPQTMEASLSPEKLNALLAFSLARKCSFLKNPFDQLQAPEVISWGASKALKTGALSEKQNAHYACGTVDFVFR